MSTPASTTTFHLHRLQCVLSLVNHTLIPLLLAAFTAAVCQLALTPVYGSIPASLAFRWNVVLRAWISLRLPVPGLVVIPAAVFARRSLSQSQTDKLAKSSYAVGVALPLVLRQTCKFSGILGPVRGVLFTTFCTTGLLWTVTILRILYRFEKLPAFKFDVRKILLWDVLLAVVCYGFLDFVGRNWKGIAQELSRLSHNGALFSRFGFLGVASALHLGSHKPVNKTTTGTLSGIVLLSALSYMFMNPHLPTSYNTQALNSTLHSQGWSLVARQESLTGYISVLDNLNDGFRVMRCDHSLLGGEWTNKPEGPPAKLNEPIYAIFVMLEAVRLVVANTKEDDMKRALVIGLGVGTAPAALIAHGVDTTVVEIDPVVYDFTTKYFNLPRNHTPFIGDAMKVAQNLATEQKTYDYIIHDVFTGGAEPIELFTQEFLTDLKGLLSPTGVIAINYAGDLLLPSALSVIATVRSVFPSCRFFRETPRSEPHAAEDFTNIVMFCKASKDAVEFRKLVESDFLNSPSRQKLLFPQNEVKELGSEGVEIIRRGHAERLEVSQMKSAIGHWYVMRRVIPAKIWENW
ncbi:hypothetical protein MMC21_005956 [Puttea exsequens]|nr:hypothetical protein [Puttea exsequens]